MTTYQVLPTVSSNDSWSASQHNTYIRDNFKAIMENGTANSLLYWQTASNVAGIAPGASGNMLTSNGTSWTSSTSGALPGLLHAGTMIVFTPGGQSSSSGSWIDITGGSANITTTRTCTFIVDADITGYIDLVGGGYSVRCSVNGTVDPASLFTFNGGAVRNENLSYSYWVRSVGAGTITVKMQFLGGAGNTSYVERGRMRALAFTE